MEDQRAVFRVDPTPTLGSPVLALGYRVTPLPIPWYRRWWAALILGLGRIAAWLRALGG
jgi:hypothetical protein